MAGAVGGFPALLPPDHDGRLVRIGASPALASGLALMLTLRGARMASAPGRGWGDRGRAGHRDYRMRNLAVLLISRLLSWTVCSPGASLSMLGSIMSVTVPRSPTVSVAIALPSIDICTG